MIDKREYDFEAGIHLYRWNDLNILLDINSGAIHLLDELSMTLISHIINCKGNIAEAVLHTKVQYAEKDIQDALQEINSLEEAGALFSAPEMPEVDLSQMNVKAICLNVAHACNMQCKYCFAQQGSFGMKTSLMSLETAKKAMDFLIQQSGRIRHLEVDFFGGEPLLVADMLKDLVAYCRSREADTEKKFNFTLTTNTLLLSDEVNDWIMENDIAVILSLDGRKEVNDRHRLLNNGEGSYEMIVPNIQNLVDRQPISYFARGTFTRKNLDFSLDLQHMIDLGLDCISLEPAVGPDNGYSIQEEDLPRVLLEYEKLTEILLNCFLEGRDIEFFHYNLNLQKGSCLARRVTGCGAGTEYLVITPEGNIYPCHQFVGNDSFYMGNIYEGINRWEVRQRFEMNQMKDKECKNCWARYFCGGGCHANAYFSNSDMSKPHSVSCAMHKRRIEGAIYLDLKKQLHAAVKKDQKAGIL